MTNGAPRIEDHALIGDMRTAALVTKEGTIDWLCLPAFDSDACFAALVGTADNGRWTIAPTTPVREIRRRYRKNTLILETEFVTDTGTLRLVDFMPPRQGRQYSQVCRSVRCIAGSVRGTLGPRAAAGVRMDGAARRRDGRLDDDVRRPRRALPVRRTRRRGRPRSWRSSSSRTGDEVSYSLSYAPSHEEAPPCGGRPRRPSAPPRSSGHAGRSMLHVPVALSRCGRPLADHAQGVHLRADRRHRRRAHHVAARDSGWRA